MDGMFTALKILIYVYAVYLGLAALITLLVLGAVIFMAARKP